MRGKPRWGTDHVLQNIRLRVTAYGTTDELNATVGMARLDAEGELDKLLSLIQNDLFDLGADLCRPEMENDKDAEYPPLRIIDAQVDRLEAEIDVMNDTAWSLCGVLFYQVDRHWRPSFMFVGPSHVVRNVCVLNWRPWKRSILPP